MWRFQREELVLFSCALSVLAASRCPDDWWMRAAKLVCAAYIGVTDGPAAAGHHDCDAGIRCTGTHDHAA